MERLESLEKMRKELIRWTYGAFYYQKDNYDKSRKKSDFRLVVNSFMKICSDVAKYLSEDDSLWGMVIAPLGDAIPYNVEDLKDMTDDFDMGLFIKNSMHGRLFEGFIGARSVIIKTWDFFFPCQTCYPGHPSRFCNELEILTDENRPSTLMKLKGFCFKKTLAVVYDEKPTKFLSEELLSGQNFGWDDRMKVATQLASLFAWLHERRFSFGSVKPSGIIIDKDFNIKVFDFEFLAPDREEDSEVPVTHPIPPDAPVSKYGSWTLKTDIYAFGVLLLELIAYNKKFRAPYHYWVLEELRGGKRSIVDESLLQNDDELAISITKMVVECLNEDPYARPYMKDVSAKLSNLAKGATQIKEQN